MVQLRIIQPGEDERVLPLGDEPITVGRAGDSTVQVSDVKLSRKHCMFSLSPRGFCVEDLNSRNGTKVNDRTVSRHLLRHGDTVQIGSTSIVFHNPPKERAPTPDAAARSTEAASFSLLARGGAEGGRIIPLQGPLTVGRGSGNDLSLDYEEVSGHHASFEPRDDTFVLLDLKSTNGTLVNGIRVNQALLSHGDDVEIGPVALLFFDPDAPDKEAVKRRFLRRKHTREAEFSFVDAEGLGEGVVIADIPFLIGSSEKNHLIIDRETVSTGHARLLRDKTGFHIEDLQSTNGTYVGGRKVRRHRVGHGDEITFGDAAFFLKNEEFPLPQDGDTPEEESQKRVVFYMGFAILAVVVVVALFAILDMMESKPSKLSDPKNLLRKNPSFEKATADGGLPGWDLGQAGGARMGLDLSSRTHGRAALKIVCPDDFPPGGRVVCRGRDSIKLKAGDVYLFGADVKVSSCQGLAGLRIRWTGGGPPSYSHLVTGSTAWLSIRTHLKVPAGVREAEVDLVTFGPAGTVWFDNVRVEKGDPGRKGWGLTRLAGRRLAADMSPRGQWTLRVENEEKISGGAFFVASSTGEYIGGQNLCMPAKNFPRAGVGYELRGEILALVDGFSIPFEEKAEMGEDSLTRSRPG
jgi:pSer/pThr/pTyr-binding forkhead associated (FHA) protein